MTTLQRVDRPRVLAWTGSTFGIKAIHVHVLEARGGNTFVKSEEQRAQFEEDVRTIWSDVVPNHFSNEDVFAREALHDFYANPDGWFRERLFGPDVVITTWRNMASRCNRGVQQRGLA